jgi:hypothetical protein
LKVLEKLAQLSPRQLVGLWHNALRALENNPVRARLVLDAIGREWDRRGPLASFDWPTTQAQGGNGGIETDGWPTEGLLGFLGYQVGQGSRMRPSFRRHLLSEIFARSIPHMIGPAYMAEWSTSNSVARLRKLSNTIASFARNAKRRRGADMDAAINDWERDLRFLHDTFYRDRFEFGWPVSSI